MAKATYIQEGDAIDYTPAAGVKAGDVIVLNELVGVAKRDLPASLRGSISVAGVFDFPKATGLDTAIGAGLDVFWNEAERVVKTDNEAGANKKLGRSVATAGDNDATVRVRLSQ